MGHTWRELDPAGAAAQEDKWDRIHRLRDGLADVSLGAFTTKEFGALMRLLGFERNSMGFVDPRPADFELLEAKALKFRPRGKRPRATAARKKHP